MHRFSANYLRKVEAISEDPIEMFHSAISRNYIGLQRYLLKKNNTLANAISRESGFTPLQTALRHNNVQSVKLLLEADADVGVYYPSSNWTILKSIIYVTFADANEIGPYIVRNLVRSNRDELSIVNLLIEATCPYEYIMTLDNRRIKQMFLPRDRMENHRGALAIAMDNDDRENVELLILHGQAVVKRNFMTLMCNTFIAKPSDQINTDMWQYYLYRLPAWDVVNRESLPELQSLYRELREDDLRVLLVTNLHSYLRIKFNYDLRVEIFGNKNVDALELLRDTDFQIEARSVIEQTALHHAARLDNSTKTIKFLLDYGADIEAMDRHGKTPIFDAYENNCKKNALLLIEYGCNVQIEDDIGMTLLSISQDRNFEALQLLVLERLAIEHVLKIPIRSEIMDWIMNREVIKAYFDDCCDRVITMRKCKIDKRVTAYNILTDEPDRIARCLTEEQIVNTLESYKESFLCYQLYHNMMLSQLRKALTINRFNSNFADIMSSIIDKSIAPDHLAIHAIREFLPMREVEGFVELTHVE